MTYSTVIFAAVMTDFLGAVPRLSLPTGHPGLIGIPLREPAVSRVLGLATRRGTVLRAPARAFHDHLHKALKTRR